jgi:hypothetical protein
MKYLPIGIAALALAAMLAGCGGGHTSSSLPPTTIAHHKGSGSVTFVIDEPSQSGTSSSKRGVKPQYISPATQSIAIAITGPTDVTETANLTIGSSGCTSTLANIVCTLTVPGLAPCTTPPTNCYTATITTYDETGGTGNVLSEAQAVTFTVTAGEDNNVGLTLSGVPATIFAAALNASANTVLVEALDADANVIVGPGAPTFSVSKTSGITLALT